MKYFFTLTVLLVLGACTSLRDIQQSCEETTSNFTELVSCLEENIQAREFKTDSFDDEYLLAAKSLSEDLQNGNISETKARAELTSLYNQILLNRARLQAIQGTRVPKQIDCRVINDRNISCREF